MSMTGLNGSQKNIALGVKEFIMYKPGPGVSIDYETADRITLLTLVDAKESLEKEWQDYENGQYLHPDDVAANRKYLAALKEVIHYFGGENSL